MKIIRNKSFAKISIAMIVILSFGTVACTEDFEDINTPVDEITVENVDQNMLGNTLAQAQYSGMMMWYQVSHNLYAGAWSQFFAIIHPNFGSSNLEEIGSWSDATFTGFYTNARWGAAANQLHFVEQYTAENEMPVENAIAKIWRVQLYHRITDYWGPIIYSQFGNLETSVPYDSQEEIYHDFFDTLDEAVEVLEANREALPFGTNDLVYGGDVEKYLKWANSMRLRLAVRVAYVEPELAQQEAEKALSGSNGVIENNSDNALLTSTRNNINKLSSITYHSEFVMSATMESIMVGYDDPRTSVYWQECCGRLGEVEGEGYAGLRNGLPPGERSTSLASSHSYVGEKWLPLADGGTNEPDRLMEAAEVYFLRAEGALRGWNMGGTAMELYNEGIRASLEARTDVSGDVINSYITSTNTPVAPDNGIDLYESPPVTDIPVVYQENGDFETQLEQIITQKWLSLYPMNDWEAWTERRRTGYPVGYAVIESNNPEVSETDLVRRLRFPTSEFNNNAVEVENALLLLDGPDATDTRVWWDKKPLSDYPTPTDPIISAD